jgi:hypothetical protein
LFGYRVADGVTPQLAEANDDVDIKMVDMDRRDVPTNVALPLVIAGAVPPHPDLTDTTTAVAGVVKRVARKLPKIDRRKLKRFREFVRLWIKKNLRPLSLNTDVSFSTWVMSRPYSLARKRELIRKYLAVVNISDPAKRYFELKCFVKDEFYPEFKHARGIYSRKDEFKAFSGPWFSAMEQVLFKLPWFIKYVPVSDRANVVRDRLEMPGAVYMFTDFTAFESSFVAEFMEACEFELYQYMMCQRADGYAVFQVMSEAIMGAQKMNFKDFVVRLRARRQSGEMCTSLGNGFSNLMLVLFAASEEGVLEQTVGFVEGDDGLFRTPYPDRLEKHLLALGFSVKLGTTSDLSRASFCGMLYDTVNGAVVTDVREALCTFGWAPRKYGRTNIRRLLALQRAKALSMAYSYPKCPMLAPFALKVLQLTSNVSDRDMYKWAQKALNQYEFAQFLEAFKSERKFESTISLTARALVAEEFGVPIHLQVMFEQRIQRLTACGPVVAPELLVCCPSVWEGNWHSYVVYSADPHIRRRVVNDEVQFLESLRRGDGSKVVAGAAALAA